MPKPMTVKEILDFCDPYAPIGQFRLGCTLEEHEIIQRIVYTILEQEKIIKRQAAMLRETMEPKHTYQALAEIGAADWSEK